MTVMHTYRREPQPAAVIGVCRETTRFGGEAIGRNDPDYQEKIIKFSELLANCVIYSNACDITAAANALAADGHPIDTDDLATISPYITHTIRRFGDWVLDLSPPDAAPVTMLDRVRCSRATSSRRQQHLLPPRRVGGSASAPRRVPDSHHPLGAAMSPGHTSGLLRRPTPRTPPVHDVWRFSSGIWFGSGIWGSLGLVGVEE